MLLRILTATAVVLVTGSSLAQHTAKAPDLGPNVFVYSPKDSTETMQAKIDAIYAEQQHSEFGSGRYAFLFLPGQYHLNIPVGFYTQVIGAGASPEDVRISGDVHSDAALKNNNATTTFWRGVEGFSVTPTNGTMQWAVSQAVFFRRMHVHGDVVLHQQHGWASGGWMSDTVVNGNVDSGSQQQWLSRNTEWQRWTGSNWNMVFVGTNNMPEGEWPKPPYTKVAKTPVVREKPFLFVDAKGTWSVRVPALQHDSTGATWHNGNTPGRTIPLSRFYIAHPERDTADTINSALAQGKHLLLIPGTYELNKPLRVMHANTVVLGLGFATLHPIAGTEAMTIADEDGITISGLLFDAGEKKSPSLLEVGMQHSIRSHATNPISLHDVFFRVGGATVGKASADLVIHSNDTIVDHTWIWRADHGKPGTVGWNINESDNGLIVNGNRVTIYGLFVEHHQQYQVLWNGEAGRTYFYQSEIPYDPPTQSAWTDTNGAKGWASYKVADNVKQHEAWGLGIYSVFRHPDVELDRAIEVPRAPQVRFHHAMTVALDNLGAIRNVINDTGGSTQTKPRKTPQVAEYPAP